MTWESPCGPYLQDTFPHNWKTTCHGGIIHRTLAGAPDDLPSVPVHLALGYRTSDLAFLFLPFPVSILLCGAAVGCIGLSLKQARPRDPIVLWFPFLRSVAWAFVGISIVWAAYWGTLTSAFNSDVDALALLSQWNLSGKHSILTAKVAALFLDLAPLLLIGLVFLIRPPATFPWMRAATWRFEDSLRILILPALVIMIPAYWTLDLFNAIITVQIIHIFSAAWLAFVCSLFLRHLTRTGRSQDAAPLAAGDLLNRLRATATKAGITVEQVSVIPARLGLLCEPFETGKNRVVLSDHLLGALEPAEVEAVVARQWSMPLCDYPDLRLMLIILASLFGGLITGLMVQAVVDIPLAVLHLPPLSPRFAFPVTLAAATLIALLAIHDIQRRAARRAIQLTGNTEAMTSATAKLALMQTAPWHWKRLSESAPQAIPVMPAMPQVDAPPVFSSSFRSSVANWKAAVMVATISGPPVLVALGLRASLIPETLRWPAYVLGLLVSLGLRRLGSDYMDFWTYRRLRNRFYRRFQVEPGDRAPLFVGLSPEPRALSYDGFYDWDLGFLGLSGDRLTYQGEKASFALDREQITEIRLGAGAPQVSDPGWIFLSWRDPNTKREGTFTLILPRADSPFKLSQRVRELYHRLRRWQMNGPARSDSPDPATIPNLSEVRGKVLSSPVPSMIFVAAANGIGMSYIARFPVLSETTAYLVLVWAFNALVDYLGPMFTAQKQTA